MKKPLILLTVLGFAVSPLLKADPGVPGPVLQGTASWYSEKDRGIRKLTANGERFEDSQLTCASWHYGFGTYLRVTNLENGKSVVCRVNDRGPSKRYKKRVVDLTKAAFKKIEPLPSGLVPVKVVPEKKSAKPSHAVRLEAYRRIAASA